MTVLDAAKALAGCQLLDGYGVWCQEHAAVHDAACAACRSAVLHGHPHADDCPIPMLPQIVAALEMATVLVHIDRSEPVDAEGDWAVCWRPADGPHWEYCPWQRLVAALKGEAVAVLKDEGEA